MNMSPNLEGLATLLVLQDQVKNLSNLKEFGYFTTNETHRLLNYNTAYLWKKGEAVNIQLLDQSEIAEIDLQSPSSQWVKDAIHAMLKKFDKANEIQALNFEESNQNSPEKDLSSTSNVQLDRKMMQHWPEMLPKYILWCPFLDTTNEISGGLIFFRENAFSEQEIKMFKWLANNYQYTWIVLTKTNLSRFYKWYKDKPYFKILATIFILTMLFPTHMSVAANATVESSNPAPISASIPGVIKEFLVKPGDTVKAGQLLMTIDKSDLLKAIAINQKKVLLTQVKLRSASNQGYDKTENRNEIPILEAQLAIDQAEMDYSKSLLTKADIISPIDGIAVFDSKEDWLGQPVQAGENILTIADPKHVKLKISLPVPDLITLEVGSKGKFYVFGQLSEIPVELTSLGYEAKMMPNKVLAYQFTAKFLDPSVAPRIGSQGKVHLYGNYVPLVYFLLRRPLQALRQTFGF
jgi:multidrug efflux pump subunit AcrA (membrane-fusion protein)